VPLEKITVETKPYPNAVQQTPVPDQEHKKSVPQPDVNAETAKNDAPQRPAFKRPESISISRTNVVDSPKETYGEIKTDMPKFENKTFTEDELVQSWRNFANTISDEVRMSSFVLNTKPVLISATAFEITVSNILQEKELIRLQPNILNFIQTHLQNTTIRMNIKLAEESEIQRANSPEDRYKIMAQQNPALDILKNGLQLEID
jgi:DNA polymerase-3 subunit gamma/tau